MKRRQGLNKFLLNLMVAMAITFVVNLSFFILVGDLSSRRVPMPFDKQYVWIQIGYVFIMSLVAISITTHRKLSFLNKVLITTGIMIAFCLLAPTMDHRRGEMILLIQKPRFAWGNQLLVSTFVLVVSLLYGKIYDLIYQRQHIFLENEKLKSENLQTRYNMLANQISPHFLFNSLNSLSMLVREDEKDKALHYVDKLSDTFRYMLQNGENEMTTLSEELHFVDAFLYLHMIRYENKLFCDIDVEPRYLSWKLPSMSIQPLIENAIKHNTLTKAHPLHISIRTNDGRLIVSNPIRTKMDVPEGTGIGLKNLASRYLLLTGHNIKINDDGTTFEVILPLSK